MTPRSPEQIAEAITGLLGNGQVSTDPNLLREYSVDRFKKYTAVHGIYDGPFPSCVAYPRDTGQVSQVLAWANQAGVPVLPRTGGTATEGGLEVVREGTVVLDCSRLDEVVRLDEQDMTVTAQCGVGLQYLEDLLRAKGLTTGHSPQSKPLAQLGGLVATRSIGQFSTLYGGIEDLVVGFEAVLPDGHVARVKNVPRRAAGPDIRHLLIGSEGGLGVITEVTLKVFRHYPESLQFFGFLVDSFADGVRGLREVITAGYRPSVARVYSVEDARQHFADVYDGRDVVIFVAEGPPGIAEATAAGIEASFAEIPHRRMDPSRIRAWFEALNWGPDKIEAEKQAMLDSRELGYTTEVSANWSAVVPLFESVLHRIRAEFPLAEDLTMLGAHSSHSYQNGTNLYFVYDYRIRCEPRDEISWYHVPLNAIIVEEALRQGGSMVHHHGIGKYRTPWTRQEHGSAYPLLAALKTTFDPAGIMNPGVIWPLEEG
ncbi:MAG: FAD-binding oxidoreductase [Actinomycetales bacterium]